MQSRSQIIATIGPASGSVALLTKLMKAGMDVARLNLSHGDHAAHRRYIKNIRKAAASAGKEVPIIADLAGPRVRTKRGHHFDDRKPSLTKKDVADLAFVLGEGVDYVAHSYVGCAEDILHLRKAMELHGTPVRIIAKIERREAVDNFADILDAADALMIARGDLGLAVPIEELPFLTRECIDKAKRTGKTAITATEMLFSMTKNEQPTRAEVTDVAHAILVGSDAVMLSEETAIGRHPVKVVEMMAKIVRRAEAASGNLVANHLTPHQQ